MDCVIAYISPGGTTRATAALLGDRLAAAGHRVRLFDVGSARHREHPAELAEALADAELAGFGSPAFHLDMLAPMRRVLDQAAAAPRPSGRPLRCFLFLNYAGITSGRALLAPARALHRAGLPVIGALKVIAGHFHHPAPFPTPEAAAAATGFIDALAARDFAAPDWPKLRRGLAPRSWLVRRLAPAAHRISRWRALPLSLDPGACRSCRACAGRCPAGALALAPAPSIDARLCLHCYACAAACRFGAISCPTGTLDAMIRFNRRLVGTESLASAFLPAVPPSLPTMPPPRSLP